MGKIHFFTEDSSFKLKQKMKLRGWIKTILKQNQKKFRVINYIFTSDKSLMNINKEYLDHNTYTDIITFDQTSESGLLEADIFISIDRIKENSKILHNSFSDELHRVIVHGVLHLLGYNDKTASEKKEMRKKENHYLALRF